MTPTSARRALVAVLAGLMLVLVAPVAAHAHRTTAVGPGQSIQAAVDAARPGDTVVVSGIHRENVAIQTGHLTLRGVGAELLPPATPTAHACFDPTEVGEAVHGVCVIGDVDFDEQGTSCATSRASLCPASRSAASPARHWLRSARAARPSRVTWRSGTTMGSAPPPRSGLAWSPTARLEGASAFASRALRVTASWRTRCATTAWACSGWKHPSGVAGDLRVHGNVVDDNTRACAADEDFPALSGIGVGLLGTA